MRQDRVSHGTGGRHWSCFGRRRQRFRRPDRRSGGWKKPAEPNRSWAGCWWPVPCSWEQDYGRAAPVTRIIWLAAMAPPAVAGGCCLHDGHRQAPPLGRIGRIVLTVLGAVLAFFFVVGIVVLLDPAEAVDGAGVWLTGCAGVGAATMLLAACGSPVHKIGSGGVYQTVHAPAAYEKERLEESFVISSINDGRRSSRTGRCTRSRYSRYCRYCSRCRCSGCCPWCRRWSGAVRRRSAGW